MKIEIKTGSDFSLYGALLRVMGIERDTIVLRNIRTGKTFTHGLESFKRTVDAAGYVLKEQ